MADARPRLVLVDAFSNVFRAFHAIRSLSNSKGLPTNATYGFLQILRKLLRDESPELIGAAWDLGEPTVRSSRFAAYKANRAETPPDLVPQFDWVRKVLGALRIPILELEGYEADDIIGTLAGRAEAAGYDVILLSADKDLFQLVTEHVRLLHTGRDKLYGPQEVEEDFGVPPARVADVLALTGDAVDNVPGVKGIGQKGAVQLIRDYGSLPQLLERAEEVTRKSYREGLLTHRDDAEMSYELVTIYRDLPIEFDVESLRHEPPDVEELRKLAAELEFHTLLRELDGSAAATEETDVGSRAVSRLPEDGGNPLTLLAIATEGGTGLALRTAEGTGLWLDAAEGARREEAAAWLRARLASAGQTIITHDAKALYRAAAAEEQPTAAVFDLMLVQSLLRPTARSFALPDMVFDRLQRNLPALDTAGEAPAGLAPRLQAVADLAAALQAELAAEEGLERVYREIESPLTPVLERMERRGIQLDIGQLAALSEEFGGEMGQLEAAIFEAAGHSFNLNSPRQLGEVLFEELGYPVLRKTRKTKAHSTDAATLEELAIRGFDLPRHLLRYRELAKLKSTYVDALPQAVAADGRLHTEYVQVGAATGRLASNNPNLQNIPVRTEDGRRIRRAFVAPPGRLLLVADYSQIELRVLAHMAAEPALIDAFREGQDIHTSTAAAVLGIAPGLVTGDQRRAAKVVNFGILYGMSAFGLSRTLGIPQPEAQQFIDTYLARYPRVQAYIQDTVAAAEASGRVTTLYGRVRWLPELESRSPPVRDAGRRQAVNAPIQGTAADLLKLAMIAVDGRLRREGAPAALLLTVHDELVLEVDEAAAEETAVLVREEMEGVAELAVPLLVDVGRGASWYEAKA